ncbi:MAG: HAD family hydrolase [bacterium]
MTKPLLIFDFDGVLVDTGDFFARETMQKLSELGYDFVKNREDLLDLFKENIAVALIENGVTPAHMCAIWEHIQQRAKSEKIELCAGVGEMLCALASKCDMAVVSANSLNTIRSVLTRLGVIDRFKSISGGEEDFEKVERIKEGMKSADGKPASTFYIGDTVGDIDEAHRAGAHAIAVGWGWHPAEALKDSSPDRFVKDPQELVDYMDEFTRGTVS